MTDIAEPGTAETATTDTTPRPRMRWGAIVWGLIVVLVSLETLMIAGSPDSRAGFADWWSGLGTSGGILVVLVVVGGFILLQGILALLKRRD